jgi:hypothetical protein
MRKDEAVGNKKKIIKIFLKSIKFFSVQKNRKITGGGGGVWSAKNVHPPRQNPRYAPASTVYLENTSSLVHLPTGNENKAGVRWNGR